MTLTIFLILFFTSAIAFGRLEKFIFGDCDLHVGANDFLGYFKAAYHIPLAIVIISYVLALDYAWFLIYGKFWGFVFLLPVWAFIEDIATWINNPFDSLDRWDWITANLGGYDIGGQFIPNTYLLFLIYTLLFIFIKIYA